MPSNSSQVSMGGQEDAAARRTFWRSASWSASRTEQQTPNGIEQVNCSDLNGSSADNFGQNRRFPVPLTPRSQQNWKARSCLPPLQPLSIARRSLDDWPKAGSDDVGEWPQQPATPGGNKGGERLKLDMAAIQRNADKTGGLVKREKIAFFDKECSKVADHVYLGGDAVAKDKDILKQNGITHVLNCVGFVCPEYFKEDFVYRTLWLQDSPTEDITSILYDVFDYFEDVREQRGRVFVHCCQGVSRSTSLVIAYLMWREGQSFDDAFQFVKAARGIADPNMGFACQLLQCQKRVHAFPLSPNSLIRLYRIAPHSPYDPLHLVPKMLTDPSPSALDSRGAFIVQVPSSLYVWIGRDCGTIMERDARGAVCQIVRYERVHGPVVMIREGDEPPFFWDSFSDLQPLMDKPGNGVDVKESKAGRISSCERRKVEKYDIDFEIFRRAIKGGVVPPLTSSENEHETHIPARESCWSVLRRKFAPSNMKDFVSAPKIILSRVYSDSMMVVHSPTNNSPASSTLSGSSSSSSPYLSPDSISSDSSSSSSSSKSFSDSCQNSPSDSCSLRAPSTLSSNLSTLCINPSRSISHTMSKNPDFIDINFSSRSQPLLASSPFRKLSPSPSLAERRGSSSRILKLPKVTDNLRLEEISSSVVSQENDVTCVNNSPPSYLDVVNTEELNCIANGEVDLTRKCNLEETNTSEASSARVLGVSTQIASEKEPSVVPIYRREMNSVIYRWPSLQKVVSLSRSDLSSGAIFSIFSPCTNSGTSTTEDTFIYLWIGRSFYCDDIRPSLEKSTHVGDLEKSTHVGDLEKIDWHQVGCDFLSRLGLPKDTNIKIVKEDEDPEEFIDLIRHMMPVEDQG